MWRWIKYLPVRFLGSQIAAWCFMGLGLLGAGVVVWLFQTDTEDLTAPPIPPDEICAEQAESYKDGEDWQMAFLSRQRALDAAVMSQQRVHAGAAMVGFLLDGVDPLYSERTRLLMVREYLLGLIHHDADERTLWRLWGYAARASAELQDHELWRRAAEFRDRLPPDSEPPFPILRAEWDARFIMDDSPDLLGLWQQLTSLAQTAREEEENHLRLARMLDNRLSAADAASREEEWGAFPVFDDFRETLQDRLELVLSNIEDSSYPDIRAEERWLRARHASRQGDFDEEIQTLYSALEDADRRLSPLVHGRLLDRLRDEGRDREADDLIGAMLGQPDLAPHAVSALLQRLSEPLDSAEMEELLHLVHVFLNVPVEERPASNQLLTRAAHAAAAHGLYDAADRYASAAAVSITDRRSATDLALFRAELADRRQDVDAVLRHASTLLSLYPGHPREAEAWFLWMRYVADIPFSEADLVSASSATLLRAPRDDRNVGWLLDIASRLEGYGLYGIAESYYRRAVLQGSWHHPAILQGRSMEAVLGQARVLQRMGKDQEVDQLLRTISHGRSRDEYRVQAGMFWATVAIRQGQYREAARRWRMSVGPISDPLIVHLFSILLPDLPDIEFSPGPRVPIPPDDILPDFVQAATDAAVETLLRASDFDGLHRLFERITEDPVRRADLPLFRYRARALEHVVAEGSSEEVADWLRRQGIEVSEAQRDAGFRSADDLIAWVEEIADSSARMRDSVY